MAATSRNPKFGGIGWVTDIQKQRRISGILLKEDSLSLFSLSLSLSLSLSMYLCDCLVSNVELVKWVRLS